MQLSIPHSPLAPASPKTPALVALARVAAESPLALEKRQAQYFRLATKSVLNRCTSTRVPFTWTINPYRGCEFGCKYCYARYTHEYLGMEGADEFEDLGAEGLDHFCRHRDRAVREGPHVRRGILRDHQELLDHVVDAFELVQETRPSVEDGAEIQTFRKMPLPTLKSSSRLKSILPEESEKALAVDVEPREVAPPPGLSSPGSGLVKSVVGAMLVASVVTAPASNGKHAPAPITSAPPSQAFAPPDGTLGVNSRRSSFEL